MKKEIIKYPNPLLRKKSTKVDDISSVQKLCSDILETMEKEKGIGLSAVQIGEIVRICAIHKDADKSLNEHIIMINPKIFSFSREKCQEDEGCLSFPGKFEKIKRSKKIKVRYTDVSGQEKKIKATGLFARVIQHELDHMDGVLIVDREEK